MLDTMYLAFAVTETLPFANVILFLLKKQGLPLLLVLLFP